MPMLLQVHWCMRQLLRPVAQEAAPQASSVDGSRSTPCAKASLTSGSNALQAVMDERDPPFDTRKVACKHGDIKYISMGAVGGRGWQQRSEAHRLLARVRCPA